MSEVVPDSVEYEALRSGCALAGSSAAWLRLTGPDRSRFANGLVSCDLRSLSSGDGTYGFFTDAKGGILSDAAFLATDDALWIELPALLGPAIAAHMRKYLVADQVEIEELSGWSGLWVAGPQIGECLADVLEVASFAGSWTGGALEVSGERVLVRGDRRLGVPAVAVTGPRAPIDGVRDRLADEGLPIVSMPAVAAVRIEEGVPWFAPDFAPAAGPGTDQPGGGCLPQETGLEDWAVSYEKGCYLGQEVVARIHFRGKVNRLLRGLVFAPDTQPGTGFDLIFDGAAVGRAGSIAHSPRLRRPIGLAIVHRKAEPGAELSTEYGPCRLVELPFEELG